MIPAAFSALPKELTLQLNAPSYQQGVMSTSQGGLLEGLGFRLQGEHIQYVKKQEGGVEIHKVYAKGHLMLDYGGQIFLGDSLEYDFVAETGCILKGRTAVGVWFISGEKILLHPDKSFEVQEICVTTSDDESIVWSMTADHALVSADNHLVTKNIQFKALNMPVFWIPYFKANLKRTPDTPLRYALSWDTGQGPKISFRYRIYSWQNFAVYLRADYRYARGPGGALEMDYLSPDKITKFQSKNYIAHDTFYNDDNPNKKRTRFRLQGLYKTRSQDGKGYLDVVYDKISDKNLPGDFKSDDFELNTARQTRATARYFQDSFIAGFNVQPRINPFDGFKQELPTLKMHVKTYKIGSSPLLLSNEFTCAYLDYVYSNQLVNMPTNIARVLRDFHAVRAESHQKLLMPIKRRGVSLTPYIGAVGILYNNSPDSRSINQLVFTYGGEAKATVTKTFSHYKHVMTPYATYTGLYKPLHEYRKVYIFDIYDGYHSLNQLKAGIHNTLFSLRSSPFTPMGSLDLYALGFFADDTFRKTFPKAGANFTWNLANLYVNCDVRWNFNNRVLDFSNIIFKYTFNANVAASIEFRHRSRFDWRKGNHQNFILDVTQSIPSMVDSPLSDGRNVLLTKAEVKLTPLWTCQVEMHNGWGRRDQPGYTEAKLDLLGLISSAWKLKLSYMYTTRGASHFGIGLNLVR